MDRFKLDKKRKHADPRAQLKKLKAELKEYKERIFADGAPNKLKELHLFLAEESKKTKAAMREEYSNHEPLIIRLNSHQDPCPCCTAASPPGLVMLPG